MESLGFIESPATISRAWVPPATSIYATPVAPVKRGAHERTVADLDPIDTTGELLGRNVRWGFVATIGIILAALVVVAGWLWQRPAVLAEEAAAGLARSASSLEPELEALEDVNATITDSQIDTTAVNLSTLSVDAAARELFNASTALPDSQSGARAQATDVAGKAIEASRLVSDAVAYRAAVIQIMAAPGLETDPAAIALDEAVRQFGSWRSTFDRVRSALPEGTMSTVSTQLETVSSNLASIQSRYVDGLREDDKNAAESALLELAAQLLVAETLLDASLSETQERVSRLIEESLSGLDRLLG